MITSAKFALGEYVVSKAGRDKDRVFIVMSVLDDLYVTVADGDLRRVENPKKKKIKHLNPTNRISEEIADKLNSDKKVTNLSIRREIEKLNEF
ncbi:MAG: KOW domain-containing RNA-binding protein [Clostridia bacterium]|nr:KOW domain-containing RNA-binding protein [Clostridia bacterium]